MGAFADCEGWARVGGNQMVLPDGTNVTGPCTLPLDGSTQWAEVIPDGIGPANPIVPPSTPGMWPFAIGTVSEMQLITTVPTFSSGMAELAVDWYWSSGEGANGSAGIPPCPCDDFAQIVIVDQASTTVIATLLYVDTYAPFTGIANTCVSGVTGVPYANTFGNTPGSAETAQVAIPAPFIGSQVIISVVAANQGDSSFPSPLYVDNFRWRDPAAAAASSTTVGTGCGGVGTPMLTTSPPIIGSPVYISLTGATPMAAGSLYVSPGPSTLIPLGMGCEIYVDFPATAVPLTPITADGNGNAFLPFGLPVAPGIAGVVFTAQVGLFGTAGPFGVDLSNGVQVTLGY